MKTSTNHLKKILTHKLSTLAALGLVSISSAYAQQTPVSDLSFSDPELQACVEQQNVEFAENIDALFCVNYSIGNLEGISQLTDTSVVYLSGGDEHILQGLEEFHEMPSLRQVHLRNYLNDVASLELLDPEKVPLASLELWNMPNVGNDVYAFLQRWEALYRFGLQNVSVNRAPDLTRFPNTYSVGLVELENVDLNAFAAGLGDTQLRSLELGGVSPQQTEFHFDQWNLPATIEDLVVRRASSGSMSTFNDMVARSGAPVEYLVLQVDSSDWAPLSELSEIAPNIYAITVSGSNLDRFSVLEGFTKLDYVYANSTQATDGDALVRMIETNPGLYLLSLGNVSALYCDAIEALEAQQQADVQLFYHSCRTDERRFRIVPPPGRENVEIVNASAPYYPSLVRPELTEQPLEVELLTAPIYEGDRIRSASVNLEFDDGSDLSYVFRYDQEKTTPVAYQDIDFADPELARCVEDMAESSFNVRMNGDEPAVYAHEFIYMLCDEPNYVVTDLTGLEHFTELRYIQMFGNGEVINDLSPILPLKKLEWLTLMEKGITDAAANPLRDYRGFAFYWQNLNLNGNELSDPSLFDNWFVTNKPNNAYIDFNQYTRIPDAFVAEDFSGFLYLSGNPINDLQAELDRLEANSNVRSLALGSMNLAARDSLRLPSSLTNVDLPDNGLTSLVNIQLPENLYSIGVANNPISRLDSLYGQEALGRINAINTDLTHIDWLAMFPALEYVALDDNDIDSIEGIADLDRQADAPLMLSLSRTPLRDYQPGKDLPWLTLASYGNAHVSCSEFEQLESSSTTVYYDVCLLGDGTIRYQNGYSDLALADGSKRFGRLVQTEDGFNFIPHPGQEGWIEFEIVITDANGNTYTTTVRIYVEPGSNPARDTGIPIVILVSGDDTEQ